MTVFDRRPIHPATAQSICGRSAGAFAKDFTLRCRREPLAGVDAFTGNPAFDAALSQVGAAVTRIAGFIGVEFESNKGSNTGSSWPFAAVSLTATGIP